MIFLEAQRFIIMSSALLMRRDTAAVGQISEGLVNWISRSAWLGWLAVLIESISLFLLFLGS